MGVYESLNRSILGGFLLKMLQALDWTCFTSSMTDTSLSNIYLHFLNWDCLDTPWMLTCRALTSLAVTLVFSLLLIIGCICDWQGSNGLPSLVAPSHLARRMISSAACQRFVTFLPSICITPPKSFNISLITISAKTLNRYGERTHPCLSPLLTRKSLTELCYVQSGDNVNFIERQLLAQAVWW